jgi:hypothetical protein
VISADIKSSLNSAALIQEDSSYPCRLLTLRLAYLELTGRERRSLIDALEEKIFQQPFPVYFNGVGLSKAFLHADIIKKQNLKYYKFNY